VHIYGTEAGLIMLLSHVCENLIRNLKTGKVDQTLSLSGGKTTCIACHPTLPIMVTALDDGIICFWDASIYR
jgi:WD40 repeat protein